MKNFLLLTTPRSGSTWLGTLLDDHPDVSMYGELFLPHDVPEKYKELRQHDPEKFFRFKEKSKKHRPGVTHDYLDHVYKTSENAVGFKLMAWPFLIHPEIMSYCKHNDIYILHLTRNAQERTISYAVAEQRNNFHSLEQESELKEKITLDKARVKKLYKKQRALSSALNLFVKNTSSKVLSTDYSDLLDEPDETMQKIYDFLELTPHNPTSMIQKTTSDNYQDVVANMKEIETIF